MCVQSYTSPGQMLDPQLCQSHRAGQTAVSVNEGRITVCMYVHVGEISSLYLRVVAWGVSCGALLVLVSLVLQYDVLYLLYV